MKNAKPSNPMDSVIIPGKTRRTSPDNGSAQPKMAIVPGQRMGAAPLNKNPEVAARVAAWLEKRGKRAK